MRLVREELRVTEQLQRPSRWDNKVGQQNESEVKRKRAREVRTNSEKKSKVNDSIEDTPSRLPRKKGKSTLAHKSTTAHHA